MKELSKSKKAAFEMSVGTMVVIILAVTLLVLGIFFVQRVFNLGTNAIDTADAQVQNQIQKLFADDSSKRVIVYPTSRDIVVKKGDDPKGFAFSVRNNGQTEESFSYSVYVVDISKCGSSFTKETANSYLLGGSGTFTLNAGNSLEQPRMVRFVVPEDATPCSMTYNLEVKKDSSSYATVDIIVTVK